MSFRGAVDVPESYRIDEFRNALRAVSISVVCRYVSHNDELLSPNARVSPADPRAEIVNEHGSTAGFLPEARRSGKGGVKVLSMHHDISTVTGEEDCHAASPLFDHACFPSMLPSN